VERQFGLPVQSIIGLDHVVEYLQSRGDQQGALRAIQSYRAQYGVER
jgi:orotate phosphoribosyltransferase